MRVVGIIPARGGSKGVPRKNLRMLDGKPLLSYTIEAAQNARGLSRVMLSTEDEEIASAGRSLGVDVPFLRPADLALDTTPTLPVIQHALGYLASQGERYDAVCILQPTSPLRRSEDIDACIELLVSSGADTVISVRPVPAEYNPHWVFFSDENGVLRLSTGESIPISRRQDLPPCFHRDGSVYAIRCQVVLENCSLYGSTVAGYVMPAEHSVNIDTPQDFERAAEMLRLT